MTTPRRRLTVTVAATVAALACALPALASWLVTSSAATAAAKATTIDPVTGVTAVPTTSTVTLGWSAPSTGAAPTSYTVLRTAPTTATVCSGSLTTSCTDSGLASSTTYSYEILSVRGNWISTAATASATTLGGVLDFLVSVSGSATAGTAKPVSVTARIGGVTDPTYTGAHTLTFSGASTSLNGDVPTASQLVTFTSGSGTASVTFYKAETIAAFTVSEASPARSGSTSVTVVAGSATRLRFTSSSVRVGNSGTTFTAIDCAPGGQVIVGNGGIFRSKVSLTDQYGNAVANGSSALTVSVSRSPSQGTLTTSGLGTIAADADPAETSGTFDYAHPTGSPGDTTVTASLSPYTSVSCTIRKGS